MAGNHIPPHTDIILPEPKQPDNNGRNKLVTVCLAALLATICITAFTITRDNRVLEYPPVLYFFYYAFSSNSGKSGKH